MRAGPFVAAIVAMLLVLLGAARAQPAVDAPHVLDVLTFNAALLPSFVEDTRQAERAAAMPGRLAGYDVLVLQEAFEDVWAEPLLDALATPYPYRTERVGEDGARGFPWRRNGGVVILSRWPIERTAAMTFGDTCSGTDCLADKGVAYASVRKGDRVYHVFGTHAQSVFGFGVEEVRAAQFALLRAFIDAQGIPADEPVLIAGDLNVDAATPELASMLSALGARRLPTTGAVRWTWDPQTNAWADGPRQWLDYVLMVEGHAAPVGGWNRVVIKRVDGLDLSDHHAVWGRVVMSPLR